MMGSSDNLQSANEAVKFEDKLEYLLVLVSEQNGYVLGMAFLQPAS